MTFCCLSTLDRVEKDLIMGPKGNIQPFCDLMPNER